ncbi:hypothetical protein DNTS_035494 [Danionella cerebrum]|uniref:Transmembrane protein 236 n=1 Tax=Danionella cerebrum TaxID=2873325 RepID=A0A553R685_9TELE|nr:hypothetical protein DNTS_035494 [Danionella translucida]
MCVNMRVSAESRALTHSSSILGDALQAFWNRRILTIKMISGKTIKLVLYELLEFACFCVPVFVLMERFASIIRFVKNSTTAYWLIVAVSLAYVASVTLFVWLPLKYLSFKTQRFSEVTNWRPLTLGYVILSTLPCIAITIASSKVQVDTGVRFDGFVELPVSLVLFSLICVDIVERIRPLHLTGPASGLDLDLELPGPILTHLQQVPSVSETVQVNGWGGTSTPRSPVMNGSGRRGDSEARGPSRTSSTAYLYSSHSHSGQFSFIWVREPRHELFVSSFIFWLDTVEMVRVATIDRVYYSAWLFPVCILAYVSILRVIITPDNPLLASASVISQDIPFLVLRICLMAVFGYVSPVVYTLKNSLVTLSFLYFVFMTRLKLLNRGSMF